MPASNENIRGKIKQIISTTAGKFGIKIDRMVLFGSRARGDYREESDWDILVVTAEKLDRETFWSFYGDVKRKLIKMGIPNDLIVVSRDHLYKHRENVGDVSYYAIKEGVVL